MILNSLHVPAYLYKILCYLGKTNEIDIGVAFRWSERPWSDRDCLRPMQTHLCEHP